MKEQVKSLEKEPRESTVSFTLLNFKMQSARSQHSHSVGVGQEMSEVHHI